MDKIKSTLIGLSLAIGFANATVYIVPSDIDTYKQRTDTVADILLNKICNNESSSLRCDLSQIPADIYTNLTNSKARNANIRAYISLQGIDTVTFCDDYTTRTNCQTYQIDDHTSFRFEVIPYNQINTYQINPPTCSNGSYPVAVPLMFTQCPTGIGSSNTFIQNNGKWQLNANCFPAGMNLPILVFCNTWSK